MFCFNTQPPEGGCNLELLEKIHKPLVSTHSHPKVAASALVNLGGFLRGFQHTATRRWLPSWSSSSSITASFNTQPPEGGCMVCVCFAVLVVVVSTHSHPKVAAQTKHVDFACQNVSTHSHPKVAARYCIRFSRPDHCFNTQPPEGGCIKRDLVTDVTVKFQHTATRRWLPILNLDGLQELTVSTHSHPKVAAKSMYRLLLNFNVSTHSHPKVAASAALNEIAEIRSVSTHSHPKVAA